MRSRHEKLSSSKPQPPDDLWQQIDTALEQVQIVNRPEGSFTSAEFAEKRGVTRKAAYHQIQKLIDAGRAKAIGPRGQSRFYVLVK